jgi:hypothetical protein
MNASPKKGDLSIAEIAIGEGFSELVGASPTWTRSSARGSWTCS